MKQICLFLACFLLGCVAEMLISTPAAKPAAPEEWPLAESPPIHGKQRMVLLRVIDGDTIVVAWLVGPESLRISGINAPEKRDAAGPAATRYMADMLGTPAILDKGPFLRIELRGRGKYGRLLGDIQTEKGWASQRMIAAGHAKPWNGEGKRP